VTSFTSIREILIGEFVRIELSVCPKGKRLISRSKDNNFQKMILKLTENTREILEYHDIEKKKFTRSRFSVNTNNY